MNNPHHRWRVRVRDLQQLSRGHAAADVTGTASQGCPIPRVVRSPLCDADFTGEFLWEHVYEQEEPELLEGSVPLGRSNSGSPAASPLEGLPGLRWHRTAKRRQALTQPPMHGKQKAGADFKAQNQMLLFV